MKTKNLALITFIFVAVIVIAFEICLAAGLPWGSVAFGGQFPGKLPGYMRVASVIQALIWAFWIIVALVRTEIMLPRFFQLSRKLMWLAVALNIVAVILNIITPSVIERLIWAPIAMIGLISSFFLAIHKSRKE